MKSLLRNYLINTGSLFTITQLIPALIIEDGLTGLMKGGVFFMLANLILIPLLKILLLPLNLLTFGLFAWLANVLALYLLVKLVPTFKISSYYFPGGDFGFINLASMELTTFQVAILVSFMLTFIINFLKWLYGH